MREWTKAAGLERLDRLIDGVANLRVSTRYSSEHTRWLTGCLGFLEEVFGPSSRFYLSLANLNWHDGGSFVVRGWDPQSEVDRHHHKAYLKALESAMGLLLAARDELEDHEDVSDVYKGRDSATESSQIMRIQSLAERQWRKTVRGTPENEKEVQEAFENLLLGADIDFSREGESIEYSSKTYRPDFTFAQLELAVEIKFCKRSEREKEMIAEINDDILAYRQRFRNLLFLVYDLGFIRDVDAFGGHLEAHDGVLVRVIKH